MHGVDVVGTELNSLLAGAQRRGCFCAGGDVQGHRDVHHVSLGPIQGSRQNSGRHVQGKKDAHVHRFHQSFLQYDPDATCESSWFFFVLFFLILLYKLLSDDCIKSLVPCVHKTCVRVCCGAKRVWRQCDGCVHRLRPLLRGHVAPGNHE